MKRNSKATRTTALAVFVALLAALCPFLAAAEPKTAADPFAGALFPPELVFMARNQIALTPEQQEALHARMEQVKPRSDELRTRLERETAALAKMAKQERVDEKSLIAQLDRVLDVERELKHLHVGLAASIKNLLTPEQQAKLREIARDGGAQFAEDTRKRLSEKVERVTEGAQKWAASGHDPSTVLKIMDEKVKPLLEAGNAVEAEAELDRVLELLKQDSK
jgi:Spy/CpxP family protein refolding chaperone